MKNMEIIALSSDDKDHERIIKFLKFGMDYVKKNLKESKEILRNKIKWNDLIGKMDENFSYRSNICLILL